MSRGSAITHSGLLMCIALACMGCGGISAVGAHAYPQATATARAVTYPQMLVLGDSLAYGIPAHPNEGTFVALVTESLRTTRPGSATAVHLLTRGGRTTAQGLAALDALGPTTERVAADLVIIELGTNDTWPQRSPPYASWHAAYAQLQARLRADNPTARFVCVGVWQSPNGVAGGGVPIADYDAAIARMCGGPGAPGAFVAIRDLFLLPQAHGTGSAVASWHPGPWGQQQIAQRILATLATASTAATSPTVPQ